MAVSEYREKVNDSIKLLSKTLDEDIGGFEKTKKTTEETGKISGLKRIVAKLVSVSNPKPQKNIAINAPVDQGDTAFSENVYAETNELLEKLNNFISPKEGVSNENSLDDEGAKKTEGPYGAAFSETKKCIYSLIDLVLSETQKNLPNPIDLSDQDTEQSTETAVENDEKDKFKKAIQKMSELIQIENERFAKAYEKRKTNIPRNANNEYFIFHKEQGASSREQELIAQARERLDAYNGIKEKVKHLREDFKKIAGSEVYNFTKPIDASAIHAMMEDITKGFEKALFTPIDGPIRAKLKDAIHAIQSWLTAVLKAMKQSKAGIKAGRISDSIAKSSVGKGVKAAGIGIASAGTWVGKTKVGQAAKKAGDYVAGKAGQANARMRRTGGEKLQMALMKVLNDLTNIENKVDAKAVTQTEANKAVTPDASAQQKKRSFGSYFPSMPKMKMPERFKRKKPGSSHQDRV